MTALQIYDRALRQLAEELAHEEATVLEGEDAGQSLWDVLSQQQKDFFTAKHLQRAHMLLVEGAHAYQNAQDADRPQKAA